MGINAGAGEDRATLGVRSALAPHTQAVHAHLGRDGRLRPWSSSPSMTTRLPLCLSARHHCCDCPESLSDGSLEHPCLFVASWLQIPVDGLSLSVEFAIDDIPLLRPEV